MSEVKKPLSIVEQMLAQQAARKAAGEVTTTAPKIELRGSGLSQKMLGKQQAQINREEKAAINHGDDLAVRAAIAHQREELADDVSQMRADFTKGENIVLDDSQNAALEGMLSNRCCVLIGKAGTGKTTLVKRFMQQVLALYTTSDIALAAFTGRATQQIRRAIPEKLHANVSTIHSLLEYAPEQEEYEWVGRDLNGRRITETWTKMVFRPHRNTGNKLTQKIFIFDEAGMIGVELWNMFMDACPDDAIIILIGDLHQLPPVMDKSILGYAMNKWPVFELNKIHRQSEGNAIVDNAWRVLQGEMLRNAPNFHLIGGKGAPDSGSQCQIFALQMVQQLAKKGLFNPLRDAFIVPQNKSLIGQDELNPHLLTMFNPPKEEGGVIINRRIDIHTGTDRKALALGDKLMVKSNINTVTPPITNGMIGIVESINLNGRYDQKRSQFTENDQTATVDFGDLSAATFQDELEDFEPEESEEGDSRDQRQASHVMTIKFENGQELACSTAGDYKRVQHAYAITCHKAQGGEYPNVVILLHSSNHRMMYQEWLYTAITRARENVYILYNNRGLSQALSRQKIKGRTLQEKIKAYNIEAKTTEEETKTVPILWAPQKIDISALERNANDE